MGTNGCFYVHGYIEFSQESAKWVLLFPSYRYVTPESSIHLLKVTPTVRALACSLHLAETLSYDHHT